MDMERMNRLMEARKYQKKAIRALFPDYMQEHIDVIQNEVGCMVKEGVLQLLQSEEGMEFVKNVTNTTDSTSDKKTKSKVKKVDIG